MSVDALSYFMGLDDDDDSRNAGVLGALKVGGIVSLGFLVVLGFTGLLINVVDDGSPRPRWGEQVAP